MNIKRVALAVTTVGMFVAFIGLQMKLNIDSSIRACTSRNNVRLSTGLETPLATCESTTPAVIALAVGFGLAGVGAFLLVGLTQRTKEWAIVWAGIGTWLIGMYVMSR